MKPTIHLVIKSLSINLFVYLFICSFGYLSDYLANKYLFISFPPSESSVLLYMHLSTSLQVFYTRIYFFQFIHHSSF